MEEATLEPLTSMDRLVFAHFPAYANFIRHNCLEPYIRYQLKGARELNTPLLKIFGDLPDDQIIEASIPGHVEFLTAAEENKLQALLDNSMKKWVNNQLEIVGRDEIEAEDLTQVSFLRKNALVHFLPQYTSDMDLALAIVKEVDTYQLEADTAATNTYIDILRDKIAAQTSALKQSEEQLLEAQRIADIGSFYSDMVSGTVTVSPQLIKVLDLEHSVDFEKFLTKVHPADKAKVREAMDQAFKTGVYECEYRLETRDGQEKIIWSRGVVAIENDKPVSFKGTVMDVTEKHHMVQRLQRSEDLYKQAQSLSHIGNWTWDLLHNRLSWSDELYKIYGLEVGSTITYETVASFNHPEDREKVEAHMKAAVASQLPFELYYRIITKDDETKILHARGEILSEEGTPYKLLGTLQDVTERQTLLEQLQERDRLYKQAQALSHLGNFSWNIVTDEVQWTDECYRIYGLEPGSRKISSEVINNYVHPQDRKRVLANIQNAIERKEQYEDVCRIIAEDGQEKIVHRKGELVVDDHGEVKAMNGTVQDVTRQQQTEQQLRSSQEFIEKIANTTPSLIASYNINSGKYTFINKALKTILGYDPEEVMNRGIEFILEIMHPEDLPVINEQNMKALEEANNHPPADGNEPVLEFKYRMRHVDGSYHWFRTFGTIFDRNSEGKVEHVLNVSIDITAQELTEQKLQQKNIELQQSNTSLEEYAYVASHDLKEPLRKIATFSDRLITTQSQNLTDDGKLYLQKIIESSKRMQKMISDLLSVSVIAGNKGFETVSLQQIFDEVLQTLEYKIEEKEAEVLSDNLPVARIVPSQFRQLFQNLIGNSLKFSREGVQPRISVSHSFTDAAHVPYPNLSKASKYLVLEFSDNGIGFDNQFAAKIFAIFQRLHGKTEYEGTGIGLAICKKIAENHGGTILANGQVNQGSTFTIIIPV